MNGVNGVVADISDTTFLWSEDLGKISSEKTSSSSRQGKNSEASDSDNVSNNGNNLLKTIRPARSKMTMPESEADWRKSWPR